MIITIDGPSASGKSTVARLLAQRLEYYYLYSGLLYRALAYILIKDYHYSLEQLWEPNYAQVSAIMDSNRLRYTYNSLEQEHIVFEGIDITAHCKDEIIDQGSSIVSTNLYVRNAINTMQYSIAQEHNAIVDGRDAGSVVFVAADYKFFLTARESVRAQRWQVAQQQKGNNYTLQEAQDYIQMRDTRDQSRINAPLIIPESAIVIDTTTLTIEQTLQKMMTIISNK